MATFFDLPPELRDVIYRMLGRDKQLLRDISVIARATIKPSIASHLLKTNKQFV